MHTDRELAGYIKSLMPPQKESVNRDKPVSIWKELDRIGGSVEDTIVVIFRTRGCSWYNFYFLEYFHVLAGSAWTGMDLVMGLFFAFVMKGLSNPERLEVSKRLIPTMLFFMPSIASVTVTAGLYTAGSLNISIYSPYFIATGIIVLILIIQGFALFLPNELRIFLEIIHGGKNVEKIVSLTMLNLKLSLSQLVFQIAIIIVMAHFATGYAL